MHQQCLSRFVAQENIALAITPSITSQQHIPALLALTRGVSQLAGVYASASAGSQVFDAELVDFLRYLLDVTAKIVPVVEEFLSSVSLTAKPDGSAQGSRADETGYGLRRQRLPDNLDRTLLVSHGRNSLRLSNAMEQTLPVICPFLPQGTKKGITDPYRAMSDSEADPALKASLLRLSACAHPL
ncbi:MAG: hypothetical protein U1F77_16695 [Kiritimatiellia bacterium]